MFLCGDIQIADSSKNFTLNRLVHSNTNSTSMGALSHTTITAQRLFVHTFPPLSLARYSFIHLNILRHCGKKEVEASKQKQTIQTWQVLLRIKNCTAELLHSLQGKGPFKCYVTQVGVRGCQIFTEKHYEGVQRYY